MTRLCVSSARRTLLSLLIAVLSVVTVPAVAGAQVVPDEPRTVELASSAQNDAEPTTTEAEAEATDDADGAADEPDAVAALALVIAVTALIVAGIAVIISLRRPAPAAITEEV